MLRVTRWNPDTCGCILEYEWDDAVPQEQRVHTFSKAVNLCQHHKNQLPNVAYNLILSENTRKNKVFGKAQDITGMKSEAQTKELQENFTWSFDNNRKLKVGFLGKLTAEEKAQLKMALDIEFGADKVEVI